MNIDIILKIILENSGLIGIFFLIGGLIKVFVYYKLFGIYIFEFTNINETLVLFVNNLLAYFSVVIFLSIFMILMVHFPKLPIFISPIIFTILSVVYMLVRKKIYLYEFLLQNILLWATYYGAYLTTISVNKNIADQESVKNYFLLFILSTLVLFSLVNAFNEYYKVKKKKYYAKTKIYLSDTEVISNEFKYYIGKTNNYFFIYDAISSIVEVHPSSAIKKIIFDHS
jgi:hypothetical protein